MAGVFSSYENFRDRRAVVKTRINGINRRIATTNLRFGAAVAGSSLVFLLLGVSSLFGPLPPADRRFRAVVTIAGFLIIQFLVSGTLAWAQVERYSLRRSLREEDEG
jgi:hypothetical protein